jgi:hypothetical protein
LGQGRQSGRTGIEVNAILGVNAVYVPTLVLNTRQLIRETYIFAICKDKGIKELCKTGKSLFKYCRGNLSILSVYFKKLGLKGVIL